MSEPADILDRTAQGLVRAAGFPSRFALRQLLEFLEGVGECISLLAGSLRFIVTRRVVWRDAVTQMSSIGVDSLLLVMITVAFSGAVVALYSSALLTRWGVSSYVGGGLVLSVVREIGPVLTAVVVAARSGSAIAAEIGTMKVTEQVDALRSLAISPVEYLVAPRVLASLVVFPMLTVFADFTGALGGYVVAVASGVPAGTFMDSTERFVEAYDISMGLVKALVFGLVVSLVCCQQGLRTRGGATGVGRSTTNAVVVSIVLIYILNFFLAYLMFGGQK
ncbi:MAG: MlaE family ABC transporter permease [Armatimonadota bacterium]|jgi:phospholipid/cholesterol/gamma-HCH transport system permease protein